MSRNSSMKDYSLIFEVFLSVYQLNFYITEPYLASVKEALFSAGAGEYGSFKQCAWEVLGRGQYEPKGGTFMQQMEYKVEILCRTACLDAVIQALKATHPCDEPAYYLIKIDMPGMD